MSADGADPLEGMGLRMTRGAAWVIGTRTAIRVMGLLSTVVLARLLTPADFGLIALATALSAALEQIGWFSFEVWLVRHAAPGRAHYDTAWTLSVIRGALIAAALFLASDPAATYFDEPRLRDLLRVLGLGVLMHDLVNVGTVDFQRELAFRKEFVLFTVPKAFSLVVVLAVAVVTRSYWALAAGILASGAGKLVLSYVVHPYRPRPCLEHWREVFHFSKWLLVGNWLAFVYQRGDAFILGKLAGPQTLGLYALAKELADLASSELVMPIRRVMLPGYSQLRDDPVALERGFVDGFAVILFVGLPAAAGIGLVADPLVRVMLGAQWLEAIPLVQVLVWYAVASIAIANQSPLLLALGLVRTNVAIAGVGAIVLVPAFIAGTSANGAYGGAVAASAVNVAMLAVSLSITLRRLRVSPWRLVAGVWRTLAASAVMAISVSASLDVLVDAPVALALVGGVLVGVLTFPGACLALWYVSGKPEGPESASLELVARRLSRATQ